MKKRERKAVKNRVLVFLLSAAMMMNFSSVSLLKVQAAEPEESVVHEIYMDSCGTWNRSSIRMNLNFSKGGGLQYDGEKSIYVKVDAAQGSIEGSYEWLQVLSAEAIADLDPEAASLQFAMNPYMYVANAQIGLVCEADGEMLSLRLPLDTYVEKEDFVAGTEYQTVTIPFADFAEGTCYNDVTGEEVDAAGFTWDSLLGVHLGAQVEADTAANWCYLDNIVFSGTSSTEPTDPDEGEEDGETDPGEDEEDAKLLEHLYDIYTDDWVNAWASASGTPGYEVSQVKDDPASFVESGQTNAHVKEGIFALRLKLQNIGAGGYQWLKAIMNSPAADLDTEHAALQFWIAPMADMTKVGDFQVGIVCESAGTYPTVRLSLGNYLEETDYTADGWTWKLVTIPLSEFVENGTYYDGNEAPMDEADFNWQRVAGVTFGGDTTDMPVNQQLSIARFDDIAFTKWNTEGDEETELTHIKDLYLDSCGECGAWYITSSAQYVSTVDNENAAGAGGAAMQGDAVFRMKLVNDGNGGYQWIKFLTNPVTGLDKTQAALHFYIAPMVELSDMQAGLVCEANGAYPTLRVSLKDYLVDEDYDANGWKWKQVVIPFTEIEENGVCYDAQENVIDGANFNWDRIAGMTLGAKTDTLPNDQNVQTNIWRLDDIAIVEYQTEEEVDKTEDPATEFYTANVEDEQYQEVTGWGVYPSNQEGSAFLSPSLKNVRDALYDELGVTRYRAELRGSCTEDEEAFLAGEFTVYMDNLVAKINNAKEDYGLTTYSLHIWSPPGFMKTNGDYTTGYEEDGTTVARLRTDYEDDFCNWIVRCLQHIEEETGTLPDAVSIQNEPSTSTPYQSCNYEQEQYIRVVKLMRTALDKAGYEDISLMGPESDEYKNASIWLGDGFEMLESDPEFNDALDIIASHSYIGTSATDETFAEYAENVEKYSDEKEIWMTEFCINKAGITDEFDRAIKSTRVLTSDMAWAGNNTWIWWLGWDPRYHVKDDPYGGVQEVLLEGTGENLYKGSMFTILSTLFNNVPVGSVVQRMSTDDPSMVNEAALQSDLVAFDTAEGTVCMITNTSEVAKEYNLSGLEGKTAHVYTASAVDQYMTERSTLNIQDGEAEGVFLPKESVTIVVTEQADTAGPAMELDENSELFDDGEQYVSRKEELTISGTVDETATVTVNGVEASMEGNAFTYIMALTEGLNTVTIKAQDEAGNVSEITLKVTYDPDYFALLLDEEEAEVNDPSYTISGRVNVQAEVAIDGEPVELKEDLTFEKQVTLEEGENEFTVTATVDGETKTVVVTVDCDSVVPVITLNNQDETVHDFEYVISGEVSEAVASLVIGDGAYEAAVGTDHKFIRKISLQEGENQIVIMATDHMGNVGTAVLNIHYEETEDSPKLPDADNALAYANKTEHEVVIDGAVDEADWVINNKAAKVFSGTPNNIVNFGTLWDEDYLYVGAVVKDDAIVFDDNHDPIRWYQHDCVEVFLHPSNEPDAAFDATKGDKQLFVGWIDENTPYENDFEGVVTGWKYIDGGYSIEMAIPWSVVGVEPGEGVEIGFDFVNDDSDIDNGAREHVSGWAGTADNWQTTADFGTLVLAGVKDDGQGGDTNDGNKPGEGGDTDDGNKPGEGGDTDDGNKPGEGGDTDDGNKPGEGGDTGNTGNTPGQGGNLPSKTGDTFNTGMWMSLVLIAGVSLLALTGIKRKREN